MNVNHYGSTDTELISRVLQGEQAPYAQLVERYKDYVFTLVLRFTGNREDAEELAQDIFVKAYRSLADFQGTAKFSTWLYAIVHNSCISFLRKRKIKVVPLDDATANFRKQNAASVFEAQGVERRSRQAALEEAIRLLSSDDTQVITLFYKGEQSLEEIGRIMGLDPKTVKVKLHRARNRLRGKIDEHYAYLQKEWQKDG